MAHYLHGFIEARPLSSILDAFCDIEEEEFKFSLKFRVFDFLVSLDLNLRFLTFWWTRGLKEIYLKGDF